MIVHMHKFLTDIDECTGNNACNESANCTDTEGSYTCTCIIGYTGDGRSCESELLHIVLHLTCGFILYTILSDTHI